MRSDTKEMSVSGRAFFGRPLLSLLLCTEEQVLIFSREDSLCGCEDGCKQRLCLTVGGSVRRCGMGCFIVQDSIGDKRRLGAGHVRASARM